MLGPATTTTTISKREGERDKYRGKDYYSQQMRDGAGLLLLLDTMATSLHWRLWPLEKSRGLQGPPPTITGPKQMKTLRAPSVVGCWRHRSCQFLVPTQKKTRKCWDGDFSFFPSTLAAGMCPAPPPPFRRRRLKRERDKAEPTNHMATVGRNQKEETEGRKDDVPSSSGNQKKEEEEEELEAAPPSTVSSSLYF